MTNNIFFSSDQHLGHENIIKYCNRPFKSVKEMDEVIIENHNKIVKSSDTVYWLGDFGFHKNPIEISDLVNRFNGRKIFILGNHDKSSSHLRIAAEEVHFRILEINEKVLSPGLTLCHFPMMSWNKSFHGSLHFHGHTHGTIPFDGINRRYDVGVDPNAFTPVAWEEVRDKLLKLPTPKDLSDRSNINKESPN